MTPSHATLRRMDDPRRAQLEQFWCGTQAERDRDRVARAVTELARELVEARAKGGAEGWRRRWRELVERAPLKR